MVNLDVITQANTIDVNMIINAATISACFGGVGVDVVGDIGAGYGVAELNELSPACGAWWDGEVEEGERSGASMGWWRLNLCGSHSPCLTSDVYDFCCQG